MSAIESAAVEFEKKSIYRVFRLGRFLELLEQRKNTLVRPAMWEDPWEEWWPSLVRKRLGASVPADVFGQCWTTSKESDAIWRVYAPLRDGVKVRTTVAALRESISSANMRYRAWVANVFYWSNAKLTKWGTGVIGHLERKKPKQDDLTDVRRALRDAQLEHLFDKKSASPQEWDEFLASHDANEFLRMIDGIDPYQHKRLAFQWEHEVRLLAWFPEHLGSDTFSYPFDSVKHIHEVVFDPRMAESLCAMVKEYIGKLGFKCRVYRSRLYSLDL